jgi:hypothetical protein
VPPPKRSTSKPRTAVPDVLGAVDRLALIGEQRGHLVPQPELRVLREGVLQVLDRVDRFGLVHVAREPRDLKTVAVRGARNRHR